MMAKATTDHFKTTAAELMKSGKRIKDKGLHFDDKIGRNTKN